MNARVRIGWPLPYLLVGEMGQCLVVATLIFLCLRFDVVHAQDDSRATPAGSSPSTQQSEYRPGLVATFSDAEHRVSLVTPSANFYLDAGEAPHPSLLPQFRAEWSGYISILQAAAYSFEGGSADISIDGRQVRGPIQLTPGRYPIRISYERKASAAHLRLHWKADHFPPEPIPLSRFTHQVSVRPEPRNDLVERGRFLFEEYGCVNCHRTDSRSLEGRLGPELTGIAKRVSSAWLYHWLGDPSEFRSGAVMPRQLSDQERRDVTTYLVSLGRGGDFEFQRMSNERGPYFGRELYSTIGCAACHEQSGLTLEGMGSKMSVEALKAYLKNPMRFDSSGRMPAMALSDEEAFNLAALLTRSRSEAFERPWQKGDPARGKQLLAESGCLSCHTMIDNDGPVENQHVAPRMETLSPERGCLASRPAGVPAYPLTSDDRAALQAFLREYQDHPDVSPAPIYDFRRRAVQLGCLRCHEFDDGGPTAPLAETTPSLADAGGKLRVVWIDGVMTTGRRAKREGDLRMPHYHPKQGGQFSTLFANASGMAPDDDSQAPSTTESRQAEGVGLLGTNGSKGGMGCIGCHGFGDFPPLGEEGPYLSYSGERLRYDWFERWMRNPARILSGTSMPNYFSSTDSGEAAETIQTLWAALSLGPEMPLPEGFSAAGSPPDAEARPTPTDKPIVVRWYMPEATPAAIAVGLPGGVSYCFDAGESRLRYAWMGGFLDMTATLYEKRNPETGLTRTADLLGEVFYQPQEFPVRVTALDRTPQRRFRGYRLTDGYPQFHYQVDGIDVYERIVAADENQGIVRKFTIPRVDRPMWFLTEESERIRTETTPGKAANGALKIPEGTDVRFEVSVIQLGAGN